MARKTAIKRLAKYLSSSASDLRRVMDRDDEDPTEFDAMKAAAIEGSAGQSIETAALLLGAPDGEILDGDAA
jgi:recombinational DNA repair protein RecT